MKLKNIIAPIQQNLRKTISLLRFNPLQEEGRKAIANSLFNRGRRKLENLEIPQDNSAFVDNRGQLSQYTQDYIFQPPVNLYPEYDKCDRNDPLGCDRPLETLKKAPSAKFCSKCGFPAQLSENKEIRGRKGIYQITRFLSRQGNGRIYTAIQKNNRQSIVIKEYLLPRRSFKSEITRQQKKEIFERIVNFQVAATIPSDFRLIIPTEGIQDTNQDRCYLITGSKLAALPNLKTYLAQHGRMEPEQVLKLLDQVLQSLEFLHSHRWQFTSGEIQQGLVHGNLSLESLLISQTEVGFLVYLWDLSVWEDLFDPQSDSANNQRVIDDLVALGNIGLYLLAVPEVTSQTNYPLNPRNDFNWRGIPSPLRIFLLKLLGLNSRFNDAATARRELRKLRGNSFVAESIPDSEPETSAAKTPIWLFWFIFATILLLGGGIWWWFKKSKPPVIALDQGECCIENIKNVPKGNFNYGVVRTEKLSDIFEIDFDAKNRSTYLAFANNHPDIELNPPNARNFLEIFQQKKQLDLAQKSLTSQLDLINNLNPKTLNFALISSPINRYPNKFLRNDRNQVINRRIAYDGLLVYVALNPCPSCEELGASLEQKITLQQLKDIYTAKVDYWYQINPNIPKNIKIQAFAPQDKYALEIFKQLVFDNQEKELAAFDNAIASGKIQQSESFAMLSAIRDIWKQGNQVAGTEIAGIGFAWQNIAYKQCNVYPLAIVKNSEDFFDMLIKKADKTGVNLFADLNCKDNKNLYQLNEAVFRNGTYPLAFSLNLLYLNDDRHRNLELGNKITEIFQTQEFQCHLSHKKLIPLTWGESECK